MTINACVTGKAKLVFDRESQSQGVVMKGYHTDNGVFNASAFMEDVLKNQQNIRFSGTGASHKNSIEEQATNTVVTMARFMFIHSSLKCPEHILSTNIFPTEIYYNVCIYNCIPAMQPSLSGIDIW